MSFIEEITRGEWTMLVGGPAEGRLDFWRGQSPIIRVAALPPIDFSKPPEPFEEAGKHSITPHVYVRTDEIRRGYRVYRHDESQTG